MPGPKDKTIPVLLVGRTFADTHRMKRELIDDDGEEPGFLYPWRKLLEFHEISLTADSGEGELLAKLTRLVSEDGINLTAYAEPRTEPNSDPNSDPSERRFGLRLFVDSGIPLVDLKPFEEAFRRIGWEFADPFGGAPWTAFGVYSVTARARFGAMKAVDQDGNQPDAWLPRVVRGADSANRPTNKAQKSASEAAGGSESAPDSDRTTTLDAEYRKIHSKRTEAEALRDRLLEERLELQKLVDKADHSIELLDGVLVEIDAEASSLKRRKTLIENLSDLDVPLEFEL